MASSTLIEIPNRLRQGLRNRCRAIRASIGDQGLSERSRKRRVTLAEVASRAGVSPSTVSRTLNQRGEISASTRAAVLEAASALNFRPSRLARSLRTQRTHTIGFVVPDVSSPFYAHALKGAQRELERSGFQVMLMESDQEVAGEIAAIETLMTHQVDGLLLSTAGLSTERFTEILGDDGPPCAFFDGVLHGAGASSVVLDNLGGIELLVDHLHRHGHERIALLGGSQAETSSVERLEGFRAATSARQLPIDPAYERLCRWTLDSAHAETLELLSLPEPPTAIVAASAELALGCLGACRERGVAIPGDIALVSYDDPYFGALLEPPLTAAAYRAGEIGERAAQLLLEAIEAPDTPPRELRIPVTLVRRRSCGCDSTTHPEPRRGPWS
jgi:LacI family transcriptional regulator